MNYDSRKNLIQDFIMALERLPIGMGDSLVAGYSRIELIERCQEALKQFYPLEYNFCDIIKPEDISIEDHGMAKIVGIYTNVDVDGGSPDEGLYVRIHSWKEHTDFDQLVGKRITVKITVN